MNAIAERFVEICDLMPKIRAFVSPLTFYGSIFQRYSKCTGVDLSKILGGKTKISGGQKVVKSDKCMGGSQLLGAHAWAAPSKSTPMSRCAYAPSQALILCIT